MTTPKQPGTEGFPPRRKIRLANTQIAMTPSYRFDLNTNEAIEWCELISLTEHAHEMATLNDKIEKLIHALEEASEALLTQHADIATYYEVNCIPTEDEVKASYNRQKEARDALAALTTGNKEEL